MCTGNLCVKEQLDYLRTICNDIVIVRGEHDEESFANTDQNVVTIGGFRVGLVSSYNLFPSEDPSRYAMKARELDVDILVHGGTHKASAYQYEGCFFLDPGSATGAFTSTDAHPTPSFILLNVQGTTAVAYIYSLSEDGRITAVKEKFSKEE